MRIAIVGFGIAGASTLIQLSKQFDLNAATDQVDVYETRPRLGAGAPYAEDDDATPRSSIPSRGHCPLMTITTRTLSTGPRSTIRQSISIMSLPREPFTVNTWKHTSNPI
ncbi:FAD/NAD(P)-binding protein [Aerococcus viridans]